MDTTNDRAMYIG